MNIIKSAAELKQARPQMQGKVAFVPTMGALHEGHLALGELARKHGDVVIYSIFVNPTQFAEGEDFGSYPRDVAADTAKLEGIADYIYVPTVDDIYPNGASSTRKAGAAAEGLESISRPHFFNGVVTVVGELFSQVQPHAAIFGEKDFQQLQVIREAFPQVEVVGAPIVREPDGLAMSSRNVYLSEDERFIASKLHEIISSPITLPEMDARLKILGFRVDYIEQRWNRTLAAAWLGKTRLIDNVAIK